MDAYLVMFDCDHYCQGWERVTTTVLVKNVSSFQEACRRIEETPDAEFGNPDNFRNMTI